MHWPYLKGGAQQPRTLFLERVEVSSSGSTRKQTFFFFFFLFGDTRQTKLSILYHL